MKSIYKATFLFIVLAMLAGCNNKSKEEAVVAAAPEAQSDMVAITPEQYKSAGIEIGTIALKKTKRHNQSKRHTRRTAAKPGFHFNTIRRICEKYRYVAGNESP